MLKRAAKLIISILLILLTTTGCWDAVDVEDRDICTAVVVDKEEDQYVFHVEVAGISSVIQNPRSEQESIGQQPNTSVVKGGGKTYAEARVNLDKALNKPIYLGAVQSLILTERLADSGIDEYALRVREMTDYRKTMDVIVTPDKPEDILKVKPANTSAVGFAIEDSLETLLKLGISYHLSLSDLLQKLESKNPCYVMNTLSVQEEQIVLIGNTVFDGGKRIGFIPYEESRGIVFMTARMKNKPKFDYVVSLDGKNFTRETTLKKRSVTARYDGENPTFDLNMSFEAAGRYPSERVTITDELRRQITDKIKELLEADIRKTIDTSQKEYECDYLSFSEYFRIAFPDAYELLDWHEEFKKAVFNVNISVEAAKNKNIDYNPKPIILPP